MTQPLVLHAAEKTLEAVHTRRHVTYPAYKPSGVEWLGDVPEHWTLQRADFRLDRSGFQVSQDWLRDCEVFHYSIPVIQETGDGQMELGNDIGSAKILILEPVVIVSKLNPRKNTVLAINPRDVPTVCSTEFILIAPRDMSSRYVEYMYQSDPVRQQLDAKVQSVTRSHQRVTPDVIRKVQWAWPTQEEQQAIARFLDEQTQKIDDLIEAKRSLLDLLKEKRQAIITRAVTRGLDPAAKLKPSGVEWLGDVPEHWDVPPLYARYDAVLGKMLDEKRMVGESLVPYLRNVDVQWDHINTTDLPEMDIAPLDYERFTVREGDLLVCEGGEVGRCAIWKSQLPVCGFQKAIHRLRPRSSRDIPRFLFYVFRCAASYGAFIAGGNPNTIPHLTGEKLRRHRFPIPPLEAQQEIVRFLDQEMEKMDDLELVVRQAIETLELLRAGIISAAVTGKIDVREDGV